MDRTQARREVSQDPLRRGASEEAENECVTAGLDVIEGLLEGSRWAAMEREAQRKDLLREADRQTRMDRVDPRLDRLVELNAEALGLKEGKRKVETLNGLLNRPKKGGLILTDARKRWLVKPKSGPSRAIGPTAELESRPLLVSRWMREEGMFTTDLDRFKGSQELFGMQWRWRSSRSRT